MAGPFESAGAIHDPTPYAALTPSAEQFAGLRTQRSPYSDGISSYLMRRFYSGIHFDQILDGINREITVDLTDKRRPGSVVYNAATFPPALSFFGFKSIQNGIESVRVLQDGIDGNIWDATAGTNANIFTKSAGAGPMRFMNVNTELFMGDGIDQKQWIFPGGWRASTNVAPGTVINVGVEPGTLQVAWGGISVGIANVAIAANVLTLTLNPNDLNLPDNLLFLVGLKLTLSGLTTATFLNAQTITIASVAQNSPADASNVLTAVFTHADYPSAPDTGTATSGTGITGTSAPTWAGTTPGVWTYGDGGQQWRCAGSALRAWGTQTPTNAPLANFQQKANPYASWAANTYYGPNGFMFCTFQGGTTWIALLCTTSGVTTSTPPTFSTTPGATTAWGTAVFTTLVSTSSSTTNWLPATSYLLGAYVIKNTGAYSFAVYKCIQPGTSGTGSAPFLNYALNSIQGDNSVLWECLGDAPLYAGMPAPPWIVSSNGFILDPSGYVQQAQVNWASGATAPAWGDGVGDTTTETYLAFPYGPLVWNCTQNWYAGGTGATIYAYSFGNSVDGSVGTASPTSAPKTLPGGVNWVIQGQGSADPKDDTIYIWATAQGYTAPLIYLAQIPMPSGGAAGIWTYTRNVPTGTNLDADLNAFISAPVASANNPPPAGITGMVYHLQRTWGFVDNLVYYSGGPDTLVGNGNTAWPPLNFMAYIGKVIKLRPITVQTGGILVYTTSGIWIILGTGTSSNPFYTTKYADKIILGGYNVEDVLGTEINLMESNGRVSALTVTYPFNPQSGYNEVGLPIGDQFLEVTTGGISAALYTPATSYLSWNIANTRDVGMYVADGAQGWFRMGAVSPPESGLVWSPRAAIAGGTSAVQNVEVSPGVFRLLIGPPTGGGPILMRDVAQTAWTDNGTAYPAWDAKGVIPLCSTGSVSEVAWIASKSMALGSRPVVSVLMGEIAVTANTPWTVLQPTAPDPADQPASKTVFSDRYSGQQGAAVMKSDSILLKFDYGSQAVADELLEFAIYGAKEEERKQQ